mgnify:CR=1 FL=1
MTTLSLDQVVSRVETLPQLPAATMRLVGVLHDPDSTLDEIVETVRYDQTITTQLLRLVNSSYFALPQRVASIEDAVRLLGSSRVLQLVMAAYSRALMSPPQAGYGLRPGALWQHSVAAAIGTQCLCRSLQLEGDGALFTAGLLHDIGKIVLNEFVSQEYATIALRVAHGHVTFCEAEAEVLGFTHAEVGALLAERWRLPAPIVRAIRHHHDPKAAPETETIIDLVHLADAVCVLMGVGGGDDGLFYRAQPDVVARHHLGEQQLEAIGCEIVCELKAVEGHFPSTAN